MTEQELLDRMTVIIVRESWDKVLGSGSVFRKLKEDEARQIAAIILQAKRASGLDLDYLMAVICQESRFDQRVFNPNGRNPLQIATTDWGIAQRSGQVMIDEAQAQGVPVDVLIERALSAEWSIPWMARKYRSLLDWAKDPKTGALRFPGNDPRYVATMAYNKGQTGSTAILKNDRRLLKKPMSALQFVFYKAAGHRHARKVMGWQAKFAAELRGG